MGKSLERRGEQENKNGEMKELSLHILDIVQNSIHAKATKIEIKILEDLKANILSITITDNGSGMKKEVIENILDPFFTTKNKKTGLGIPLFKQHAELAGGDLILKSEPGKGTELKATFEHDNFDRQPMGNIVQTIVSLIRSNPEIDYIYQHKVNKKEFELNMVEIKQELEGLPVNSPEIIGFLEQMMSENLKEIGAT